MTDTSLIEAQAEYYANIPIIDRTYKSSVHLEDMIDEKFWDIMLQECRPGKYYYIYYSKNESGKKTTGCEQCLKYKNYLSNRFFICIDSDLRYLEQETEMINNPYILQTYTYSWENHYFYAEKLEQRWRETCPEQAKTFSFLLFIDRFSSVIYHNFIHFLTERKRGLKKDFPLKRFDGQIPRQCKKDDLQENGQAIIEHLCDKYSSYVNVLDERYYQRLGLNQTNAYLFVRGKPFYMLLTSIGKYLCYGTAINFEEDVLLKDLQTKDYWQIDRIREDISRLK